MWFWRIYLGIAAVGVVLSLLGWAGFGLLRLSGDRVPRSTRRLGQGRGIDAMQGTARQC